MPDSYDLTQLDAGTFEHLVNYIALKVLGAGHTDFGPGSDGGRDGYFEGEAPYPSETQRWSGTWYIQSKFHKPHLSGDPQKWLVQQIKDEIAAFNEPGSNRVWPDYWIIATNIDPSGYPQTGAFDRARSLVESARPELKNKFHIWGGRKILDFLGAMPEVAQYYGHFLTPGHVLTELFNALKDAHAQIEHVLRYLIVTQFTDQQYTKLEQAGSSADNRPGIHKLFTDLPFHVAEPTFGGLAAESLSLTASENHRIERAFPRTKAWARWRKHANRSRVWFVRGGPGQGKSTIGQFFCQVQRAALILSDPRLPIIGTSLAIAEEVKQRAVSSGVWPAAPRVPVMVELKDFAQWLGQRRGSDPSGILSYLADKVSQGTEQKVLPGSLLRAFSQSRWFFVFDGP